MNAIDKEGREWKLVKGETNSFEWVKSADARDKNGNLLPYHYEQAILFTAEGLDGKSFNEEDDHNIGSSTAVVYKADGTTENFDACTNPSDTEKYATVPAGTYEAKVGLHHGSYRALRVSDMGTKNFNSNSIELGQPNPSNKKTTKARGINIHKAGRENYTGENSKGVAVSKGCLLIDIYKWDKFISIFENNNQINNTVCIIIDR